MENVTRWIEKRTLILINVQNLFDKMVEAAGVEPESCNYIRLLMVMYNDIK